MRIYKSEDYIGKGTIGIFREDLPLCQEAEHSHDFIEVVYILSGSATQWVDGEPFDVTRGDVVFINYGARHAFCPKEAFRYVNICFLPEVLSSRIINGENALALLSLTAFEELRRDKNGGRLTFCAEEREEVEFILNCMLREYSQNLPSAIQVMESYLSILFAKMLRKTRLDEDDVRVQDVWQALQAYIDENLEQKLTLAALAKQSFYNPSYFSRIFKQKFGISLSRYLRDRRIRFAMELLQNTDLSIEDIMERTGYTNRSAFYHAFVRIAGLAPAEYREKVKTGHIPVK